MSEDGGGAGVAASGASLAAGMRASRMTNTELWLRYIAVGGDAAPVEVEAYVHGALVPSSFEHDVLAQALNEHFLERGEDHPVRYAARTSPPDGEGPSS